MTGFQCEHSRDTATLYLNDQAVGTMIDVRGWDDSWGFGDFSPSESFANFAVEWKEDGNRGRA